MQADHLLRGEEFGHDTGQVRARHAGIRQFPFAKESLDRLDTVRRAEIGALHGVVIRRQVAKPVPLMFV